MGDHREELQCRPESALIGNSRVEPAMAFGRALPLFLPVEMEAMHGPMQNRARTTPMASTKTRPGKSA